MSIQPVEIEEILKKLDITSVEVESEVVETFPDNHGMRQFEPTGNYTITIRGRKKVPNE
jgi:hypothetical protein